MTYDEIEGLLEKKNLNGVLSSLRSAVDEEVAALRNVGTWDVRALFAEDIARALDDDHYLQPARVLSHRPRYVVAWAIAETMKEYGALPDGMEVHKTEDVSDTLIKLCTANAEIGVKLVELMMRMDSKTDEIEVLRDERHRSEEVMLRIRAAAGLQPGDGVSLVERVRALAAGVAGDAVAILEADRMTAAKNMIWVVEKVHDGHHGAGDWRECEQGVCRSVEHMLAQVGLDKRLQPTERKR